MSMLLWGYRFICEISENWIHITVYKRYKTFLFLLPRKYIKMREKKLLFCFWMFFDWTYCHYVLGGGTKQGYLWFPAE